ncbi:MAG: hypothetical protein ABIM31_05530 [candidate division WOR-3 bacterium]
MYLRHSRALIIVIFILAFSCKQKEMIFSEDDAVSVWQRKYGGNGIDIAYSICPAKEGGYLVAGYTESYGAGGRDVYLLKIDENGNKVWERTYGGRSDDKAYSVCPANSGGYVVAGYSGYEVYLLKIDENGNKVWHRIDPEVDLYIPSVQRMVAVMLL